MNWHTDLRTAPGFVAAALPPVMVEETAWDVLLALHSRPSGNLSVEKLACLSSATQETLTRWLVLLEQRQLITGKQFGPTAEVHAVLTAAGRDLLDRYLSTTSDLRLSASS